MFCHGHIIGHYLWTVLITVSENVTSAQLSYVLSEQDIGELSIMQLHE